MAATRPITICDVYDRIIKGKKVDEDVWDYDIIPNNATKLKEKYKLDFGNKFIPEDKELMNNLFNAGLEMLVETGFYCQDLGRVFHVTEEEVWEGIKKTPKYVTLGDGTEAAKFYPRRGNSPVKPIIQGGPTGSPYLKTCLFRSCSLTLRKASLIQSSTVLSQPLRVSPLRPTHPTKSVQPWRNFVPSGKPVSAPEDPDSPCRDPRLRCPQPDVSA